MSHTTRKSFRSDTRDRIKHSAAGPGDAKKGGGGGAFTWGLPGDELKFDEKLDHNDPNYDPMEETAGDRSWSPPKQTRSKFAASMKDLQRFKKTVKEATDEYLLSNDFAEYQNIIEGLDLGVYHQDLPYILIKFSFDKSNEDRVKICALLHSMHDEDVVSSSQMSQGFRKLYNHMNDLVMDTPAAKVYLQEFVNHATISGYLNQSDALEMQEGVDMEADSKGLAKAKAEIHDFVEEYFESADMKDATKTIKELKPVYHFEVVKKLVSMALDRNNFQRARASKLIAAVAGDAVSLDAVEKGFGVLLERVEDMFLDVPRVQTLLSCFLARAVIDEALAPAFLARADLAEGDMGSQVVEHARSLLKRGRAGEHLQKVWADPDPNGL